MGKIALLLALLIKLTINPQVALSPTDLIISIHIKLSDENRKLIITLQGDESGEAMESEIPLSPNGPSTYTRTYRHLTTGSYTITATLVTTTKTYSDVKRLEVMLE